jgi:hypothetical protein
VSSIFSMVHSVTCGDDLWPAVGHDFGQDLKWYDSAVMGSITTQHDCNIM